MGKLETAYTDGSAMISLYCTNSVNMDESSSCSLVNPSIDDEKLALSIMKAFADIYFDVAQMV